MTEKQDPTWRELTEGYIQKNGDDIKELRETLLEVAQEALKSAESVENIEERISNLEKRLAEYIHNGGE